MSKETLQNILTLLDSQNIVYRHLHHKIIPSDSKGASLIRGTTHEHGAKALVLQTKSKNFLQVVIPAHRRTALKKIRKLIGEKNVSLASPDEVKEKTDCIIGSVPPMSVLWNLPMIVDPSVLDIDEVVFSAGTLEDSIFISPTELVRVNNAQIADILAPI